MILKEGVAYDLGASVEGFRYKRILRIDPLLVTYSVLWDRGSGLWRTMNPVHRGIVEHRFANAQELTEEEVAGLSA